MFRSHDPFKFCYQIHPTMLASDAEVAQVHTAARANPAASSFFSCRAANGAKSTAKR